MCILRVYVMCVCARERGLNVCARYVSSSREIRCLYANRKLTISSTRAADRPTTFLLFPSLYPFFFPLFFFTKNSVYSLSQDDRGRDRASVRYRNTAYLDRPIYLRAPHFSPRFTHPPSPYVHWPLTVRDTSFYVRSLFLSYIPRSPLYRRVR